MWRHIEIQNFRALGSIDAKLEPLTVLVGANDSGKSTFMEALLCLGGQQRIIDEQRRWQEPRFKPMLRGQTPDRRVVRTLGLNSGIAIQQQRFRLWPEHIGVSEPEIVGSTAAPRLHDSGGGLPGYLDYLLLHDSERFAAIVEGAKELIAGLEGIEIHRAGLRSRRIDLYLPQGVVTQPDETSDGVRRLLFFLALSFHPDPPEVVLIEEPESGVNPSQLPLILNAVRALADGTRNGKPTQVVMSTHSPYLVDAVNLYTEQVLVFERLESGECTAGPADLEKRVVFHAEFLLGGRWYDEGETGLAAKRADIDADGRR